VWEGGDEKDVKNSGSKDRDQNGLPAGQEETISEKHEWGVVVKIKKLAIRREEW